MACKIKSSHSFCVRYANLDQKRERAPIFSPPCTMNKSVWKVPSHVGKLAGLCGVNE